MKVIVFIPKIEQNGHLIEDAIIVKEKVSVFLDFDRSLPPIGAAILSKDENGIIYADLYLQKTLNGFYPYIGGTYTDDNKIEIREIGVGTSPNTDDRILTINQQVLKK